MPNSNIIYEDVPYSSVQALVPEDYSNVGSFTVGDIIVGGITLQDGGSPYIGEFILGKSALNRFPTLFADFDPSYTTSVESSLFTITFSNTSYNTSNSASAYTVGIQNISYLDTSSDITLGVCAVPEVSQADSYELSTLSISINGLSTLDTNSILTYATLGIISYSTNYSISDITLALAIRNQSLLQSSSDILLSIGMDLEPSESDSTEDNLVSLACMFASEASSSSSIQLTVGMPVHTNADMTGELCANPIGLFTTLQPSESVSTSYFAIWAVYIAKFEESSSESTASIVFTTALIPNRSEADSYLTQTLTVSTPIVATTTIASEFKFTLAPHTKSLFDGTALDVISSWAVPILDSESESETEVIEHIAGAFGTSLAAITFETTSQFHHVVSLTSLVMTSSQSYDAYFKPSIILAAPEVSSVVCTGSFVLTQAVVTPEISSNNSVAVLNTVAVSGTYLGVSNSTGSVATTLGPVFDSGIVTNGSMQLQAAIKISSSSTSKGTIVSFGRTLVMKPSLNQSYTGTFRVYFAGYLRNLTTAATSQGSLLDLVYGLVNTSGSTSCSTLDKITGHTSNNYIAASASSGSIKAVSVSAKESASSASSTGVFVNFSRGLVPSLSSNSSYCSVNATLSLPETSYNVAFSSSIILSMLVPVSLSSSNSYGYAYTLTHSSAPILGIADITSSMRLDRSLLMNTSSTCLCSSSLYDCLTLSTSFDSSSNTYTDIGSITAVLKTPEESNCTVEYTGIDTFYTINEEGNTVAASGVFLLNYAAEIAYNRVYYSQATAPRIFYSGGSK